MIERTALAGQAQRPGKDSILFVMTVTVPATRLRQQPPPTRPNRLTRVLG